MAVRRDVVATQQVLADLLADVQQRRAWARDPWSYASSRLTGSDEAAAIAGLDRDGLDTAALALDVKRATTKPLPEPDHSSAPAQAASPEAPPSPVSARRRAPIESPRPLVGLGYWPDLLAPLEQEPHLVDVWEHRIDDYLYGPAVQELAELAEQSPVVFHSVDLSVGSSEALADRERLARLRHLLAAVGAQDVSDHLCFTRVAGRALGHFVPLWRVEEALDLTAANVERLQETLGVRLALENIAPIFDPGGEMTVAEFLNRLVERTGCGVLLDITNLTLSEGNGFCNAGTELDILNLDAVMGVHVAGGAEVDGLFYDAHAFPVPDGDFEWLRKLLPRLRNCRTVVMERDGRRHALSEVIDDLRRLRATVTAALPEGRDGIARGQRA
jgi:uncharacterized protein (UPF0276 family)